MFSQTAGVKWNRYNNDYFHRYTTFSTQWPFTIPSLSPTNFTLNGLQAICAENGGPICLVAAAKNTAEGEQKVSRDFENHLRTFTNSGALLHEMSWPPQGSPIVAYGWTYKECLATIAQDGTIQIYNIHGARIHLAYLDGPNDQKVPDIATAEVSRYGIAVSYRNVPNKIGYYSFYLDDTCVYPDLPPNTNIVAFKQVLPMLSHITGKPMAEGAYNDDEYLLLCDTNDESRYKMFPTIAVFTSPQQQQQAQPSPTTPQQQGNDPTPSSLYVLSTNTINAYTNIFPGRVARVCVDHPHSLVGVITENNIVYCLSLQDGEILYQYKSSARRLPQTIVFCGSNSLYNLIDEEDQPSHHKKYPKKHPNLENNAPKTPYNNILLHWNIQSQSLAMVVGPNYSQYTTGVHTDEAKHFLTYKWSTPTIVCGENDYTVRVISANSCDLIQCIHPDILSVLLEGSKHPATQLLSAYLQFKTNHMAASTLLQHMQSKGTLYVALQTLFNAAKHYLYDPVQNIFLQACSFGRNFVVQYDPRDDALFLDGEEEEFDINSHEFVDVCRTLQLLYNVKQERIGIPLTFAILHSYYSLEQLVIRITTYHQHELAVKICQIAKIPSDVVVNDWCRAKLLIEQQRALAASPNGAQIPQVTSMLTFEGAKGAAADELFGGGQGNNNNNNNFNNLTPKQQLILNLKHKLSMCQISSYLPISLWANHHQNKSVATALAYFEPLSVHQTALFLSLQEFNTALRVAYQSGDYELLIVTLYRLKETMDDDVSFARLIHAYPDVEALWLKFTLYNDYPQFNYHITLFTGSLLTNDAAGKGAQGSAAALSTPLAVQKVFLESTQKLIGQTLTPNHLVSTFNHYSGMGKNDFYCQQSGLMPIIEEYALLFQNQQRYHSEDIMREDEVGMSVIDTIKVLLHSGKDSRAKLLKQEFKISDQQFAYITIQVYVQKHDLSALHLRATELAKMIPNGFEYIVDELIDHNQIQEAKKYIMLLGKYTRQLEYLCDLQLFQDAAMIAYNNKDVDALYVIRDQCQNSKPALLQCEKFIQELGH